MRDARPPRVRPVFLDRSGRRRRLTVLVGTSLAAALLASLALLLAGLSGAAPIGVPGFPDRGEQAGADGGAPEDWSPTAGPDARRPQPTPEPPVAISTLAPTSAPPDPPGRGRDPSRTPPSHPRPSKPK
jgi:hypothetical protein